MKKNITINLCGRLFQIDEDAYELLQQYIESLRSYFGRQEGGDEIVDDIEARIAELFDELRQQGIEAITIDHVKDIISRIGKPEQMAGEDDGEHQSSESKESPKEGHRYDSVHSAAQDIYNNVRERTAGKKLYRNPKDKMVAGVLSGFATYTNTDPVIWRLAIVVFTAFYGIGLIVYLVLAIVLPEAKTPEQLLQMEGKEVTPQNLADIVVEKDETATQSPNLLRSLFSLLLKLFFGLFVGVALVVCLLLCICALVALVMVVCALVLPISSSMPWSLESLGLAGLYQSNPMVIVLFTFTLFMLLLIPIYAIIHMVLSLTGKTQPMGTGQRVTLILLWIAALCCVVPCFIIMNQYSEEYFDQKYDHHVGYRYQGVKMSEEDRDFLRKGGWNLLTASNCAHYTWNGQYPSGDPDIRYLDTYNDNCEAVLRVERNQEVEPGVYRMDCLVRAEGPGAYVYAMATDSTYLMEIPAYEDKPAGLYELLQQELEYGRDKVASLKYLNLNIDSADVRNHAEHLNSWSVVTIDSIVSTDGTIAYGMTSDRTITNQDCRAKWFSATDFTLTRIGDLPKK